MLYRETVAAEWLFPSGSPAAGLRRWGGSKSHLPRALKLHVNWRTAVLPPRKTTLAAFRMRRDVLLPSNDRESGSGQSVRCYSLVSTSSGIIPRQNGLHLPFLPGRKYTTWKQLRSPSPALAWIYAPAGSVSLLQYQTLSRLGNFDTGVTDLARALLSIVSKLRA